jgi:hypothetical protein
MTDGEVVKIARRMTRIQHDLFDLIHEIENSAHPNAGQIAEALREQCIFYAWPTHVVYDHLQKPGEWELVNEDRALLSNLGIKHKGATRATARRRLRNARRSA